MSWAEGRLCAFDTESTGVDVEADRIVSACMAWVGGGEETVLRRWLVAVDVDIPAEATEVHGITTERARAEGLPARSVVRQVVDLLTEATDDGVPLVVFNAPFDLTLLDRECRRCLGHPLPFTPHPVVDPLCIDKALDRFRRGKRTLIAACETYKVNLDGAHAADEDALAAARLAWRLARVYPAELADLQQLHDAQTRWFAAQAASFAEYLRRLAAKASTADECESLLLRADGVGSVWPMVPFADVAVAS